MKKFLDFLLGAFIGGIIAVCLFALCVVVCTEVETRKDDLSMIGWFIIDQVIGKHELITYALGINPDGSVHQLQVVEYLETYGSQVRYLAWRDQFVGKTVESPLRVDSDIVNITGATMSARHLTDGIRRLLFLHQSVLR